MPLVSANQFQLTPDFSGAAAGGINAFNAAQQGQRQQQQLGINQQQADRQQFEDRAKSVLDAAVQIKNLPTNEAKLNFARSRVADLDKRGVPSGSGDSREVLDLMEAGKFDEANSLIDGAVNAGIQTGRLEAPAQPKAQAGFTLGQGQTRFGPGGDVVAEVAPKLVEPKAEAVQAESVAAIPDVLLSGLPPEVSAKGAAAFTAAGGGKDGLTAFQKIVDAGTEQEKRIASPQILKSSFPQASEAESVQLQAAMDASKTTSEGLKAATKVRTEQRRTKKAKAFQSRAVELLNGILESGEGILGGDLGDVLGSVEGAIDFRLFSDDEAQIIADIEEASNILTADNMDLMSGVLSESDIKILKNLSGGALNRKRTKERFVKDVTMLRDKLSSQQVQTADDIAKARNENSDLKEGQIISNKQTGQRLQVVNGQLVEVQ